MANYWRTQMHDGRDDVTASYFKGESLVFIGSGSESIRSWHLDGSGALPSIVTASMAADDSTLPDTKMWEQV